MTTTTNATTTVTPTTTTSTTTTVASTTATSSPPTFAPTTVEVGPLEFVDGRFLGIAQGSLLADAAQAFGVTPARSSEIDPLGELGCTGTEDPWVIQSGGLTMVFEDWDGSADTARLTNWSYAGGPIAGFTEMVAARGISVGSTRQDVAAAYPEAVDLDRDYIFVYEPVNMRFRLTGDTVDWFGVVDCVFEEVPED